MNIYTKLTLLCVFLIIASSSVLFYFTNIRVQKNFREELQSNVTNQSKQTIANMERFIFSRLNDVKLAAKNPFFKTSDSTELINRELKELESLNDLYYNFSFYDSKGVKIADSKGINIGEKHSDDDFLNSLENESSAAVGISHLESIDEVVIQFASKVRGEETDHGILIGRIPVDRLYQIFGNISIGSDSLRKLQVNLISNTGLILYSNDPKTKVMQDKYKDMDLVQSTSGNEEVNFVESDDMLYFIAKEQGYLNYAGNDWSLIVSIPKDEAFLPIYEFKKQLFGLILLVLAVSILLTLVAANIFVKPIVKLSKAAEEIGEGKLNTEINIKTNDEVGKLAKQLTNASSKLIAQLDEQKNLNQKLAEQRDEISNQKVLLEQVNAQIHDSIIYAQRIQRSILPELKVLDKLVKDAFVLYRPKDVVSGDFYWFERVRQGRNEYLIIACADCTGHGVPGAIMSIMGSNQLTNIVYYQNYMDPNKILARLDKVIKFELQRDAENTSRDGLEIGVCVINLDDLSMEFSGAGIPLYHKKKGSDEIDIIRSPRLMIGGIEGDEKEVGSKINKEQLQLEEGDLLYMASDGFQDQFGGEDDKKFMTKNFRKLLKEISTLPMNEQKSILEERFEEWKGNTPQTDDVIIIGVEI